MIHGLDLFSGIGGLSLALEGWVKPMAYCEIDKFAQGVLLSRMLDGRLPGAPIWDDVTSLNGTMLPSIDIIYGGFPCQDISLAGIRKGLEGKRSSLFFEIVRLTNEIRPSFVFLENVWPGVRKFIPTIRDAFTQLRYEVRDGFIAAEDCGANHRRLRWFMLAHSDSERLPFAGRQEIETEMEKGNEPKFSVQAHVWDKSTRDSARMDDGVPPRTHRIKSCGNAVVPIQAREAFKRLMGIIE